MKKSKFGIADIVILGVLSLWALAIFYPFYNTFLVSIVTSREYTTTPFMLYPKNVTFEAYKFVFSNPMIMNGFKNTVLITITGVTYNMFLTVVTAYALSKKGYPGQKVFMYMVIITMFFSGGLIPSYLLVKGLHLTNKLGAMILPYGINVFYMLVVRNYFLSIPESLEESAKLDGANDITILFRIILPLSMPVLATFFLFYSVDRWNEWYNGLLYIKSPGKYPLQLVLRNIINNFNSAMDANTPADLRASIFSDGIRMASVIVTMSPIMCLYPFLQKYFIKGILVGAVKS